MREGRQFSVVFIVFDICVLYLFIYFTDKGQLNITGLADLLIDMQKQINHLSEMLQKNSEC